MSFDTLKKELGIPDKKISRRESSLPKDEIIKVLNVRVPKSLLKKVKIHCLRNDLTVQDFMNDLLKEKLKEE